MLDITVLRVCKTRSGWNRINGFIPAAGLGNYTDHMLKSVGKYYNAFPNHSHINHEVFPEWFIRNCTHGMDRETAELHLRFIHQMFAADVDEHTANITVTDLVNIDTANKLATIIDKFENGDLEDALIDIIRGIIDKSSCIAGVGDFSYIDKDIGEILQQDLDDSGIRWRIEAINRSMRPMRPGDFGIIAGRPDTGKTTFLASEATYWAAQVPPDRPIIWLNNEGPGDRIIPRLYQAALGCAMPELIEAYKAGNLKETYARVIGSADKIRVKDIHGWTYGNVGNFIERHRPSIVIYDMIDHIAGFSDAGRTDERLEEMYKWARIQCVKHSCIGIATSQISSEGDGVQFPGLSMLKDSKTGKQGQADFQLMIGTSNAPDLQGARWICLPKNKLHRVGGPKSPNCEVWFRPDIARYEDVQQG